MRALMAVVLTLAALWGGYWFVGSRALERGAEAWFAGAAAQGFVAERESLSVQGFPSRFDLTVNGLRLADPSTGFGWQTPFVQVFSLSYKPWHVIAALPNTHIVTTPFEDITLASAKLQGSFIVKPLPALPLDRIAVVGENMRGNSSLGWQIGAQTVRFATRLTDNDGLAHEIGFEATNIAPDPVMLAALAGADLPALVDMFRLDAVATFSAPLDRFFAASHPRVTGLDVRESVIRWGDLSLIAKGRLIADAGGLAEGRIDFRIKNWRKALAIAVAAGSITPEVAPTYENGLTLLAAASTDPETLDLPLIFANGRMSLGPLPLGPAPRLN
jgi:hypothetical protein